VIPTARRAIYAAVLCAKPRLLEPVYLVEIQAPERALGGIYSCLNTKRGQVFEEMQRPGTPMYNIKAYLPVLESFGFTNTLRAATSGEAFPQCVFDHWEMMMADPMSDGSQTHKLVMDTRKRKGSKMELPVISDYEDKYGFFFFAHTAPVLFSVNVEPRERIFDSQIDLGQCVSLVGAGSKKS
jgi:elongation factor 2